jgi:hypothetical protein
MSVRENAGRGKSYWGLVEQVGPWKETAQDRRNKSSPYGVGTGTPRRGRGGTVHAGHGSFDSLTIPGCVSGRKPPPKPSVYAQRSVVYKPLVFDGPRGIAGRIGAKLKHMKGLGDTGHNGHDQGVQTSGNFSGVGVPARQNLSEIQQVATGETSATRLPELQGQLETHEENSVYGYFNRLFSGGDSTRATGTVGSAVGMTPHPGTEIVPGETVGQVLGRASGAATRLAALTATIPVVNGVTAAAAAGLGAAAGGVAAAEALGEGDVLGAIANGREAYRQGQQLQAIGNGLSIAHGQTVTIAPQNTANGLSSARGQTVNIEPAETRGVGVRTDITNADIPPAETRGVGVGTDITNADMQNYENIVQELQGLRADQRRENRVLRQRLELREQQLNDTEENVRQLRQQFELAANEIQRLRREGGANNDERLRRLVNEQAQLEELLVHAQRESQAMRRNVEELHEASVSEIERGRNEIARLQGYLNNTDRNLPRYGAPGRSDFGTQAGEPPNYENPPVYAPPRPTLVDQAIQAATTPVDQAIQAAREIRPREQEGFGPGPARARPRVVPTAEYGAQMGESFVERGGNLPQRMHPIENQHSFRRRGNTISTQTPHFEAPAAPLPARRR